MKILELNSVYPAYIKHFYQKHTNTSALSYAAHKELVDYDSYGGMAPYAPVLGRKYGCEMMNVFINMGPLQNAWARENNIDQGTFNDIAFAQIQKFKPDILFYNHYDEPLLDRILQDVKSIKTVVGWVGSAIPKSNIWPKMDLILSCAPEAVHYFKEKGIPSLHLHHAFDPLINERIKSTGKNYNLTFIGQIVRSQHFHREREEILTRLAGTTGLTVFSSFKENMKLTNTLIKEAEYSLNRIVKAMGSFGPARKIISSNKSLKRIYEKDVSRNDIDAALKKAIKPAVFGLDMYEIIKQSDMVLNSHADSSPVYASNMRLWETTGVGTCLITDWKQNIDELFVADKEVIVYKSADECIEKVSWLRQHHEKTAEIGRAGQLKCINEHSYEKRAEQLYPILNKLLH